MAHNREAFQQQYPWKESQYIMTILLEKRKSRIQTFFDEDKYKLKVYLISYKEELKLIYWSLFSFLSLMLNNGRFFNIYDFNQ